MQCPNGCLSVIGKGKKFDNHGQTAREMEDVCFSASVWTEAQDAPKYRFARQAVLPQEVIQFRDEALPFPVIGLLQVDAHNRNGSVCWHC
jgi:hypothetical protein